MLNSLAFFEDWLHFFWLVCNDFFYIYRGLVAVLDTLSQLVARILSEKDTVVDSIQNYIVCIIDTSKANGGIRKSTGILKKSKANFFFVLKNPGTKPIHLLLIHAPSLSYGTAYWLNSPRRGWQKNNRWANVFHIIEIRNHILWLWETNWIGNERRTFKRFNTIWW